MVFSDEEAHCKDLGSFMGVTASFGLALASLALEKFLLRKTDIKDLNACLSLLSKA